ncbi:hypothetical protein TWF106_005453 [Orbilia oligospora]|uniref:Nuclear pore complex component n=1 Tax=Orbilia oligospora TaxID=2813651 RepID=A0A6G1M3S9_ORBOL|nr:hypothetical protein TWF679_000620 [Orbilia oligospora]KAF3220162.1 hypothetical protein TWF191_007479 [Orbilia oligospora]KAF3222647.1 hypothetical protein TWF106_005453 [Orbilia oligospora]KAF3243421.1 hypothetical protein TWF192_008328 [Orbilia oligospora]
MPGPTTPSRAIVSSSQGTPGSWKHPKLDEVLRRQDARSFSDRRVSRALKNVGALGTTFVVTHFFYNSRIYSSLPRNDVANVFYLGIYYLIFVIRIILTYNTVFAIIGPLLGPDPMTDIPLTDDQRSILSLPPTPHSTIINHAGEVSQYITPPRYNRSSPLPQSPLLARPTTPTQSTTTPGRTFANVSGISNISGFSGVSGVSSIGYSGKPRVTAAGSPIGPGQLLGSPGSFRSPSPVFNTPSPFKTIGSGLEKRHSFSSPMGAGARNGMIGQGSLAGALQGNMSPSVVASGKWLHEQKNRRRDIF